MKKDPRHSADLYFFDALISAGSLSAVALRLGVTPSAASKRLIQLEKRLGMTLVNRSTRRMSPTAEGLVYLDHARSILAQIEALDRQMFTLKSEPEGLIRVNATLGFGRSYIQPLISRFIRKYPAITIQLFLTPFPPPVSDNAFDLSIQFGKPPLRNVKARLLAQNRRLLVASGAYLARAGRPLAPQDLLKHNCIVIKQDELPYSEWILSNGKSTEKVPISGNLVTNDGYVGVQWALDGHGVVMRAEWDVARYMRSGRLVQVLANYSTPNADIYAVYREQPHATARMTLLLDFLSRSFGTLNPGSTVTVSTGW
ncbi:LysR family transcriptional regulator [Advenella kashmirensis W13003]|uniref:LysR family transcriptional regulator n=1 Tax=Advenella kashmirensis W13003 TaxID=1424334 RepID=V8QRY8_9BURK|nr:LysR family transcriptional regulator [Advenella kashmirensis]ETF02746.1 LysR family transcriptional regulator [Advenella kashmirensis W13003]